MNAKNDVSFMNKIKTLSGKDKHISRLIFLLIGIFILLVLIKPESFLKPQNFESMAYQFPEFGLMALGVMITMITGGIDLSVVGVANMASISSALALVALLPKSAAGAEAFGGIVAVIIIGLLVGMVAGFINGLLISKIKIPPILATLGSFELFTGIAIILTKGKPISGLPIVYSEFIAGKFLGIPMPLIVFALAVIVLALLINKTTFGTKIYMLGTNPTAARFSGLKSDRLLIKTYMLSGIFAALGGLVMLANYNSAKADYGSAYTLQAVLIVVLGGVNPAGGSGKVSGVVLSILILQMLSSGLNMFPDISNFYKPLIWGAVLLLVIVLNYSVQRSSQRKLSKK